MIGFSDFGRLRLSPFLIGQMKARDVDDWEFLGTRWVGEVLDDTEWLRLKRDPKHLYSLSLNLIAFPLKVSKAIMDRLGVDLHRGMALADVERELGESVRSIPVRENRVYVFGAGKPDEYEIHCAFGKDGLAYVTMIRTDAGAMSLLPKM